MMLLDDILIGVLASALVAYADRLDSQKEAENREAVERLRAAAKKLRTASGEAELLVGEALREFGGSEGDGERLAASIGRDPVHVAELVQWLLREAGGGDGKGHQHLVARLVEATGIESGSAARFLARLDERAATHPQIGALRADRKLTAILAQVHGTVDLRALVEKHHSFVAAQLQRLLDGERRRALRPVQPQSRTPSANNGLLHGNRPSDADIDEDLDFRRTRMPEVLAAIKGLEQYPAALVFLADAQRGKTTFLKRIGWELAMAGRPVVQLQAGSRGEPYAQWIEEATAQLDAAPLIVLIDDPLRDRDNFEAQMTQLHDRDVRTVVQIASRPSDWKQVRVEEVPLLRRAACFDLNPDRFEAWRAVEKLIEWGILRIDPLQTDALREAIERLPFSEGYFHTVICIASDERFQPTPLLVAEKLKEDPGSQLAVSFERLYAFVSVAGSVGLGFPEDALRHLLPEHEIECALRFAESGFASPPVRRENGAFWATHETHAAKFLEGRDLGTLLRALLGAFVERRSIGNFAGQLVEMLRLRGLGAIAQSAWEAVADAVSPEHWTSCEANPLSTGWGSFFFHQGLLEQAEAVTSIALRAEPDSARAHNGYAIVLRERGNWEKAADHYVRAIELDPEWATPHYNYASLLAERGSTVEARRQYLKAIDLDPEWPEAHMNYALFLDEHGDPEIAAHHFERSIALSPDDARSHNNYAKLLAEQGELDDAVRHYCKAIELDQSYAKAYNNYALLLAQLGRLGEAEENHRKAIELAPDYANSHYCYAMLLERQEKLSDAAQHYCQVVELEPDAAEAHRRYADVLMRLGDVERAEHHIGRANELESDGGKASVN